MALLKTLNRSPLITRKNAALESSDTFRYALCTHQGMRLVHPTEILRCEAEGNYTSIFLLNGERLLISKTLANIEASLPKVNFIRVHQSHLIQIGRIRAVLRDQLELSDGMFIPVSRSNRRLLQETISRICVKL